MRIHHSTLLTLGLFFSTVCLNESALARGVVGSESSAEEEEKADEAKGIEADDAKTKEAQEAAAKKKKEQEEKRILLTRHESDLTVLNLYVVNGQSVDSDKYKYKLKWLKSIQNFIEKDINNTKHYIIVGDFNIAPEDRDVYSPEEWKERILCSEKERKALQDIMGIGLMDCFRIFDQDDNLYSWWDYRSGAFRRNHGLRIDLILANKISFSFFTKL